MQPRINMIITLILNTLRAFRIYSYFPRIRRINAPEIPGSIIAQIARAPERKTNPTFVGVSAGVAILIKKAMAIPMNPAIYTSAFHLVISRATIMAEIMMSPKKKDQTWIGNNSNKTRVILDNVIRLKTIPESKIIRKFPLIYFQNSPILNLNNNLSAVRSKDCMELSNSSYIPVIKAIVPPDTPGTTSAPPMAIPLRNNNSPCFDFPIKKC
jgi:hypothetical protein